MKKCPNCNQIFGDETAFCLDDGTPLVVDTGHQGLGGFQSSGDLPTQFIQRPQTAVGPASGGSSNMLYLVIGILATALVGVGLYLFLSRDSDKRADIRDATTQQTNNTANTNNAANNRPSTLQQSNTMPVAVAPPAAIPGLTPAGNWTGEWNSRSANFTAAVNIAESGGKVSGQIVWTLQRSSNPNKAYKAGLSATEFVQGSFNPSTRMVKVRGVRKDDPNGLVILDNYNLSLAEDGRTLSGVSKNGNFRLRR